MADVHIVLAYKNFAANQGVSHIGLGVSALNNAKVLNTHGINTSIYPIVSIADLKKQIAADSTVTHVVISAPWILSGDLQALMFAFPKITFAVNCHSNTAFLQADTRGVKLLREYIDVEQGGLNFHVAGNSKKFVRWLRAAYQCPVAYLPNMYYLDYSQIPNRPIYNGGILRVGAFGATRPQKNLMAAAGATLELSQTMKVDTEFYVSAGRTEGGGNTILNSVREMLVGIPGITLKELGWASWPQFRDLVRRMHVLMQVSYTESFNMITADGVAEGVPSVVSDAIEWTPEYWQAYMDKTSDIARVARQLIYDPRAPHDGLVHLEQHNQESFDAWASYVGSPIYYKSILKDPYLI